MFSHKRKIKRFFQIKLTTKCLNKNHFENKAEKPEMLIYQNLKILNEKNFLVHCFTNVMKNDFMIYDMSFFPLILV